MPTAHINGVNLYYEVTGKGFPLVWCHEFGGNYKSWDPQVKFFSRRYQVITYNSRGWPPSDVPTEPSDYSQELLVEDLHQLLHYLNVRQAYVGGLSMGGNIALNFGIAHPDMTKGLVIAATGAGTTGRENFEKMLGELARNLETEGWKTVAERYGHEPNRAQLLRKDPKSWQEYYAELASHSDTGSVHSIKSIILKRPTIFALEAKLKQLKVPALIMVGDEDNMCIEPALFLKQHMPSSGLVVFPQSGHVINLEEAELFNRVVSDFLTSIEAGSWV
jgi:pimeloyl-ACP methyl ester carboxylesterase